MIYVSRRLIITCLLLLIACVMAGVWGLRSGAVTLETSQVFAALMGDAPRSMTMVVTEWRLPRVLMALLIGAALGVSGAIFQSLMRTCTGYYYRIQIHSFIYGSFTFISLCPCTGSDTSH